MGEALDGLDETTLATMKTGLDRIKSNLKTRLQSGS